MSAPTLFFVILALSVFGFFLGQKRATSLSGGQRSVLHSRPSQHGLFVAAWCGIPALVLALLWIVFEPQIARGILVQSLSGAQQALEEGDLQQLLSEIRALAAGRRDAAGADPELLRAAEAYKTFSSIGGGAIVATIIATAVLGLALARRKISTAFRASHSIERLARGAMIVASAIAVLTTVGIILSLLFESLRFFAQVPFHDFLFGIQWSPQTALREDQVGASGTFGAIPLFVGTLLITLVAMATAVPIGLFSAIYLSEYATPRFRAIVKPILEILAGVPTVVYGFFAALTVAPLIRGWGEAIGLDVASESALAAGLVMGMMIIPFVSSLTDDVMSAVPQSLRDGAYAMGATQSETVMQIVIPAALPGIVGAILLAVSRAIGETMIVVMAAGLAANLTINPLEAVTTVTVQIVTLLVGDQEFDSAKTLAAFALGLTLFLITLSLNVLALQIVKKYREKYD